MYTKYRDFILNENGHSDVINTWTPQDPEYYNIHGYKWRDDGKILDTTEPVKFKKCDFTEIPFKFGVVYGSFELIKCSNLTSLEGCPELVTDVFYISGLPKIKNLKGCPNEVRNAFYCFKNHGLTNLEGITQKCNSDIYVSGNDNLESLLGVQTKVNGVFDCSNNIKLSSLEHCPVYVKNKFDYNNLPDINIEDFPIGITVEYFTGGDPNIAFSPDITFEEIYKLVKEYPEKFEHLKNNKIKFHQEIMRLAPDLIPYYLKTSIPIPSRKTFI